MAAAAGESAHAAQQLGPVHAAMLAKQVATLAEVWTLLTLPCLLARLPPACPQHAIGHVAANLSFAAVAISLTHTVKTLEPAFNVVLSQVGF